MTPTQMAHQAIVGSLQQGMYLNRVEAQFPTNNYGPNRMYFTCTLMYRVLTYILVCVCTCKLTYYVLVHVHLHIKV